MFRTRHRCSAPAVGVPHPPRTTNKSLLEHQLSGSSYSRAIGDGFLSWKVPMIHMGSGFPVMESPGDIIRGRVSCHGKTHFHIPHLAVIEKRAIFPPFSSSSSSFKVLDRRFSRLSATSFLAAPCPPCSVVIVLSDASNAVDNLSSLGDLQFVFFRSSLRDLLISVGRSCILQRCLSFWYYKKFLQFLGDLNICRRNLRRVTRRVLRQNRFYVEKR